MENLTEPDPIQIIEDKKVEKFRDNCFERGS